MTPREWEVDLAAISARLSEISSRLAPRAASPFPVQVSGDESRNAVGLDLVSAPLDQLMLKFESLGDNCEFGLVQRFGGAEPLGLLRFASIFLPVEVRLQKLIAALERNFEGLGEAATIKAYLAGEPGRREFMVRESAYDLMYHTFIREGECDPDVLQDAEGKRLGFLRRKLLEDLATGDKIRVWRSHVTSEIDQVRPLLDILRRLGPNILLWVVEADGDHAAGTVESLAPDFIKGYVRRFAPYIDATDIHLGSWLEVCWRAYDLCDRLEEVADPDQGRGNGALPVPDESALSRLWKWLRRRQP